MTTLNADASRRARAAGIRCATDVTGFGVLGHLFKLARASGVSAVIDRAAVPLIDGTRAAARAGHAPGGSRRNLQWCSRTPTPGTVGEDDLRTSGAPTVEALQRCWRPAMTERVAWTPDGRRGFDSRRLAGRPDVHPGRPGTRRHPTQTPGRARGTVRVPLRAAGIRIASRRDPAPPRPCDLPHRQVTAEPPAGLHAPALRRRPLLAKPRSVPRGRTLSARYPRSGEVAVAGDQQRDHEVEPDPRPGLPPGAAGYDLRSLVDRGQHATDHRGYRNAGAHGGPMGEQPRRFTGA